MPGGASATPATTHWKSLSRRTSARDCMVLDVPPRYVEHQCHNERLFTFLEQEGVEPTNNSAERAPAHRCATEKNLLWESQCYRRVGHGSPADRCRNL